MKNIVLHFIFAVLLVGGVLYLSLYFIEVWTHHNQYISVPELKNRSINEVQKILNENHLRFQVVDSSEYNPNLPKYAVINQSPAALSRVKENRKIYLTINPSGYRKVTLPRIIQITRRSAEATLKAVGLEVGAVSYEDNIGKDMVLKASFGGKEIFVGDQLPLKSKVDLVCGNGNQAVIDSIAPENQIITKENP